MVQVYVTRIDEEMDEETFAGLYAAVSDYRRQKTDRLKRRPDKVRSLAAGALFRYGMERDWRKSKDPDWWEKISENIRLDSRGKLYLEGVSFNLSHGGIYAAAAIGVEPVGIDVEGGRAPSERIAARFHPEEQSWYEKEGEGMFYRLWTAKESVMKRDGRGIAMGLDSFSVFSEGLKDEIYSLPLDGDYWLSLCTSEEWNGEIHQIEIKELLEKIRKK